MEAGRIGPSAWDLSRILSEVCHQRVNSLYHAPHVHLFSQTLLLFQYPSMGIRNLERLIWRGFNQRLSNAHVADCGTNEP